MSDTITNDEVAEALGWVKTYTPHSSCWHNVPYWDDDGGYMGGAWKGVFEPTTDGDDAISALRHLIDTEKITEAELCKFICEFIVNRKKEL